MILLREREITEIRGNRERREREKRGEREENTPHPRLLPQSVCIQIGGEDS